MNKILMGILVTMGATAGTALASHPKPWQIGFQPAASPIMENLTAMHNLLLTVIACIAFLVVSLLAYVLYRFRASKNPIPTQTSHNTLLEIVWTLMPVLVLIMIGIPSLKLMFFADKIPEAQLTVKAVGHQWYWTYEYPDHKVKFDSLMVEDKDLKPEHIRLLSVDKPIVVPVGKVVRVIVTSEDVLHSFAVPALGIKRDATPGRLSETWFQVAKPGMYYGQCSELCGIKHGFMPIAIHAVSDAEYEAWLKTQS